LGIYICLDFIDQLTRTLIVDQSSTYHFGKHEYWRPTKS